jgi:hypothetical protein
LIGKRIFGFKKIGSEIQYLQTKSNYEAQIKAVLQLKQQMAKTVIKAPFSGIVDEIITDKGSVVAQESYFKNYKSWKHVPQAEVPENTLDQ